jgi:hypothetical protein
MDDEAKEENDTIESCIAAEEYPVDESSVLILKRGLGTGSYEHKEWPSAN